MEFPYTMKSNISTIQMWMQEKEKPCSVYFFYVKIKFISVVPNIYFIL